MIIKDPDAKDFDEGPPQGGPSTAPVAPPSFAESTGALAPSYSQFGTPDVFIPQGGEEPPPEFTPYEAEYFVSGSDGDIVSHDRHLNEDGECPKDRRLDGSDEPSGPSQARHCIVSCCRTP